MDYLTSILSLLAAIITAVSGFYVFRHQRLVSASDKLRDAFAKALEVLRYSGDTDPADILIESFPAHETSVHEFERLLSESNSKAFLDRWYEYAYYKGDKKHLFLEQYSSAGCDVKERERRRILAIERITNLFRYAK